MTKMVAMPIYVKKRKKRGSVAIGMEHCVRECYLDCSNYDPGLTLTYFTPRSNLVTQAFAWAKVKIIYNLGTVAAIGLSVGQNIQIKELMKLNEY